MTSPSTSPAYRTDFKWPSPKTPIFKPIHSLDNGFEKSDTFISSSFSSPLGYQPPSPLSPRSSNSHFNKALMFLASKSPKNKVKPKFNEITHISFPKIDNQVISPKTFTFPRESPVPISSISANSRGLAPSPFNITSGIGISPQPIKVQSSLVTTPPIRQSSMRAKISPRRDITGSPSKTPRTLPPPSTPPPHFLNRPLPHVPKSAIKMPEEEFDLPIDITASRRSSGIEFILEEEEEQQTILDIKRKIRDRDFNRLVNINIGGKIYHTTVKTLTIIPCMFADLTHEAISKFPNSSEITLFIDRSPGPHINIIIDYLRICASSDCMDVVTKNSSNTSRTTCIDSLVLTPETSLKSLFTLIKECKYYGLLELVEIIKTHINHAQSIKKKYGLWRCIKIPAVTDPDSPKSPYTFNKMMKNLDDVDASKYNSEGEGGEGGDEGESFTSCNYSEMEDLDEETDVDTITDIGSDTDTDTSIEYSIDEAIRHLNVENMLRKRQGNVLVKQRALIPLEKDVTNGYLEWFNLVSAMPRGDTLYLLFKFRD